MNLIIDTTHGSLLHRIAAKVFGERPSILKLYLATILLTYAPLVVAAALGPLSLLTRTETVQLPFLLDWNVAFMLIVSLPMLVILTVTDHDVLSHSLERVQLDGVVVISKDAAETLSAKWARRFRSVNYIATAVGVVTGGMLAVVNYLTYAPADVRYWISSDGHLLGVGVVLLVCIYLFYMLVPIYVFRSIAVSLLLRDIVANSQLRMLPFHPDRCGGLSPIGRLGLRNQYGLTMFGVNIVLLVAISLIYLRVPSYLYGLIVAAIVAYLLLGPLVFLGPLLPFRAGMLRTKCELMGEVAQRLRVELQRLRSQLKDGEITKQDEELIDRLRKVGAVIGELPVWPFDAGTLRKFLGAYVVPAASAVLYPLLRSLLDAAAKWLPQ